MSGCLPIVLGVVAVSFLSGGCQKASGEAIATGVGLMLIAAFAAALNESDKAAAATSKPTDNFQVVIETSSGRQFVFSSKRESEADAVARAVNESIANYQKH